MSFQLKRRESVADGACRVIVQEEEKAESTLTSAGPTDEGVHAVRKRFKKARALLKLLRKGLGSKRYRRENDCLRDAGRPLTEVRDGRILVESLDKLVEHFSGEVDADAVGPVRAALVRRGDSIRRQILGDPLALATLAAQVKRSRRRLEAPSLKQGGWPVLAAGLKRTYQRGRDALREALAEHRDEQLHEWRKRAKDLRHQLEFLQGACPEMLGERAKGYHELTDTLGDDHDLVVLGEVLKNDLPLPETESAVKDHLYSLIDRRRRELQEQAFEQGRQLYDGEPGDFIREVRRYWKSWRAGRHRGKAGASA